MDEQVIVKGENVLRMSLRRTSKGLKISVKAHPLMEELIRGWGNGQVDGLSAWGRFWQPEGDVPLRAYMIPETVNHLEGPSGPYSMAHLAQELVLGNGQLNMSWLRLEGISGASGVTFVVSGVYSLRQVNEIAEKIKMTIRQFYMDYLLPVTVHLTMSTEETRG